jgi:aryl-alcohol dehydrogenase-like predicted oxidoreductase
MNYRRMGNSGLKVSEIGLGANRFGSDAVPQKDVNNIIDASLEMGINFIDTANTYTGGMSEKTLGQALRGRWDRFVLASKFSMQVGDGPNDRGASRYHMMNSIDTSLRRLQNDHIDLYYVHRWDPLTPVEETLKALDDLIRLGKIRYVGASKFAAWQLAHSNLLAELMGWTPFVVIQSSYHLLDRGVEEEVLPYCDAHGVGLIPYFPLAGGFLTGKYKKGKPAPSGSRGEYSEYVQGYMTDRNYDLVENLTAWAGQRDRGINELALAWLLAKPQICAVISGSTKLEHVLSNAKAADWSLTPEETDEINQLLAVDL